MTSVFCPRCRKALLPRESSCRGCGLALHPATSRIAPHRGDAVEHAASSGDYRVETASLPSATRQNREANPTRVAAASNLALRLQTVLDEELGDQWNNSLSPSGEEMRATYSKALGNDFIAASSEYRPKSELIEFFFDQDDYTVNASAGVRDPRSGRYPVRYNGGHAIVDRLLAAGISAADLSVGGEIRFPLEEMLTQALDAVHDQPHFTTEVAFGIFESCLLPAAYEVRLGVARSISETISYFTVAHELGHILLGHLDHPPSQWTPDVNRNMERQADTFAANLVSHSAFREYFFMGALANNLQMVARSGAWAVRESPTHPAPMERFELLLRNTDALSEFEHRFGVTKDTLLRIASRYVST